MNNVFRKFLMLHGEKLAFALCIFLPLILVLTILGRGYIHLWYDPSRDLLSAWDNLTNPTLIGPTSGIPGIFYGPYWIWLLSFGMLFSKDPLVVTIITATIPYFIIFPFLWYKLTKSFGITASLLGWLLFSLTSGIIYSTLLWNPYPAPLIALAIIYLLAKEKSNSWKRNTLFTVITGFLLGLLINFHISFGIGFFLGTFIYLISFAFWQVIQKKQKRKSIVLQNIIKIFTLLIGFGVSFTPSLVFELRHGFNQTKTLLNTLSQYGAVVEVKGLSKEEILEQFMNVFTNTLHISSDFNLMVILFLLCSIGLIIYRQFKTLTDVERKIVFITSSLFLGLLFIYLTAKNPVWKYHFYGVDLLAIILLTFTIGKLKILQIPAAIIVVFIIFTSYKNLFVIDKHLGLSDYQAKKEVVNLITKDAQETEYTVYAYSSAIYSYEYSYLFKWLAEKDVPYDPGANKNENTLYLILPRKKDERVNDYINFRGQDKIYKTTKTWNIDNQIEVIKREKK